MKVSSRHIVLVLVYVLVLVAAALMSAFEVLGLLPLLLIIGAAGGLLHLSYIVFFAKLPDYINELKSGSERPKGRS
jgi:hypothetical protein